MKYPKINDPQFYTKIKNEFKEYKIKKQKTFDEYCFPKKYELQVQQLFLENLMSPTSPYKGLLIYHKIGAGKTCAAIRIAERWKNTNKKIIIVLPAFLKSNFRTELRSLCADNNYLTPIQRSQLKRLHPSSIEYKKIIKDSNKKIDKNYLIVSYNKFITLLDNNMKLSNSLVIIDEIQNLISDTGIYYQKLYDKIHKQPKDFRIILLSATPMYDKPNEIALLMNLLQLSVELPVGQTFNNTFIDTKHNKAINLNIFKKYIRGYISYYGGAPSYVYPKMNLKYEMCEMGEYQYKIYTKTFRHKHNKTYFFLNLRLTSNVAFPNAEFNGLDSLTPALIKKDLKKYSIKFYKMLQHIQNSKGPIFIYSSFRDFGGIRSLEKVLKAYGYVSFLEAGEGEKRYAIWSGNESEEDKEHIKTIFNNKDNMTGNQIQILLGSPSIREGVSLLRVRQIHILEPYWNNARMEQIMGRAFRYCSHKDLAKKDRVVDVYIYLSTYKKKLTIDKYIYNLAKNKEKLIKEFERALQESAVDCALFKVAHNSSIKCDT